MSAPSRRTMTPASTRRDLLRAIPFSADARTKLPCDRSFSHRVAHVIDELLECQRKTRSSHPPRSRLAHQRAPSGFACDVPLRFVWPREDNRGIALTVEADA